MDTPYPNNTRHRLDVVELHQRNREPWEIVRSINIRRDARWLPQSTTRHLSNSICTCINKYNIHDNDQGYPHTASPRRGDGTTLHAKRMPAHRAPAVIPTYVIAYAYE